MSPNHLEDSRSRWVTTGVVDTGETMQVFVCWYLAY